MTKSFSQNARCEIIEHTSDMGIRASADTVEELFQVCIFGMMKIISGNSFFTNEKPAAEYPITLYGEDTGSLLYAFLSEILYLFDGESIIPLSFKNSKLERGKFSTIMEGIIYDPKKTQDRNRDQSNYFS